jgi:hypothetical protein
MLAVELHASRDCEPLLQAQRDVDDIFAGDENLARRPLICLIRPGHRARKNGVVPRRDSGERKGALGVRGNRPEMLQRRRRSDLRAREEQADQHASNRAVRREDDAPHACDGDVLQLDVDVAARFTRGQRNGRRVLRARRAWIEHTRQADVPPRFLRHEWSLCGCSPRAGARGRPRVADLRQRAPDLRLRQHLQLGGEWTRGLGGHQIRTRRQPVDPVLAAVIGDDRLDPFEPAAAH